MNIYFEFDVFEGYICGWGGGWGGVVLKNSK